MRVPAGSARPTGEQPSTTTVLEPRSSESCSVAVAWEPRTTSGETRAATAGLDVARGDGLALARVRPTLESAAAAIRAAEAARRAKVTRIRGRDAWVGRVRDITRRARARGPARDL